MAKKDNSTLELPGLKRPVGRPRSDRSLSNAERQRRFRSRHSLVESSDSIASTIKRLAVAFDLSESAVTKELLRFALCNKNWFSTGFPLQRNGN